MLKFVLNCIPQRVFWKDRDSIFLGCNKHFARDAGLEEPEDLVGKSDHQLGWRESADAYRADDRSVIRTGRPKLDFEELQMLNDGTVRWLTTSKVPLRDAEENIIGVLGTYQDITDRKNAEKQLEEYAQQLERSNEELQQFAYVASHDLGEPLRMVSNYLQLLERKEGDRLDATSKQYIDYAVDGAKRMRAMIEDILTYSRVESRAGSFVAVDMGGVLDTVLKDLGRVASECGAAITHDPLPTVVADRGQMFQLLTNLVGNAIKYRGVAAPQVHVAARREEREFVFSVADNGIGIDARYHDNIFQMFERLHTRDEYPGTGMGLAIAKKIVERHGGRIWVESRPDEGTTFYFTLPSLEASKLPG
jgi:PAS domain S-box-containing protein